MCLTGPGNSLHQGVVSPSLPTVHSRQAVLLKDKLRLSQEPWSGWKSLPRLQGPCYVGGIKPGCQKGLLRSWREPTNSTDARIPSVPCALPLAVLIPTPPGAARMVQGCESQQSISTTLRLSTSRTRSPPQVGDHKLVVEPAGLRRRTRSQQQTPPTAPRAQAPGPPSCRVPRKQARNLLSS